MADDRSTSFASPDPAKMQAMWTDIADRSQRMVREFAERNGFECLPISDVPPSER